MRKIEKRKLTQRTSIRGHLPKLRSTSDAPVKLVLLLIFLLGVIPVWNSQNTIATAANDFSYISPVAVYAMEHIFGTYITIGGIFITILILIPLDKKNVQDQLRTIGFVNHADMVPELKRKYKDKQNPRISIWEFTARGIPLKEWKDKQADIETVLDITIVKMKNASGKSRVLLYTVPARTDLPDVINWNPKFISKESFILVLGESLTAPVTVDLVKIPHILLGGSTGSGKSVLLKLLLMQAILKGAQVCISDFKGGVDFPPVWHKKCRICGRADTVLSQIILDNTSAAEQIPKDARGRFLLHGGTVFQAYWFDDEGGW